MVEREAHERSSKNDARINLIRCAGDNLLNLSR
jgi:hypothetical protein